MFKTFIKSFLKVFYAVIFITIFITGCISQQKNNAHQENNVNSFGAMLTRQEKLTQILKNDGIELIQTGDETALILPQKLLFYAESNNFRPKKLSVLNDVAAFINAYPAVDIQVKGYTGNDGDYKRELALSRAQAQAAAAYLWGRGLSARLISAQGYGCHNFYGNSYIEIFFRLPPPDNVFH